MTGRNLVGQFEEHRSHLHKMAFRMLGSATEADDAVQETWLRFDRTDTSDIQNVGGWLTTVNARVCLNFLRTRVARREQPLDAHVPDPVIQLIGGGDPADAAVIADSVSLALLVVLDTLSPGERVAFVLHDVFDVPFEEIAPLVDRSPEATRKLASRARRRVQTAASTPRDLAAQRPVVAAFFDAAQTGNLERLVSLLHPDAVLRSDGGSGRPIATAVVHGAPQVAQRAAMFARTDAVLVPAVINGGPGVIVVVDNQPISVMAFVVVAEQIRSIDVLADPDRLLQLELGELRP